MAKKKASAQDVLRGQIKELVKVGLSDAEKEVFNLSAGSLLLREDDFDVEIRIVVKKERVELPEDEDE